MAVRMNETDKREIIEKYLDASEKVDYSVRLPESELDVMQAVWKLKPPVTTSMLMKEMGNERGWRTPTMISFLLRLEERGFIISYKNGKERCYIPVAERDVYISLITREFLEKHHGGSITGLLDSLYNEEILSEDIDSLISWLKSRCDG